MSHITRFVVGGLAGRASEYSQVLNRDTNLFFGLNGSGKTSLLKILNAALNNSTAGLLSVPFKTAEVSIYSETFNNEYTYRHKKSKKGIDFDAQPMLFGSSSRQHALHEQLFYTNYNFEEIRESITYGEWEITPALPKDFNGGWEHTFLPTDRLYNYGSKASVGGASQSDWDQRFEEAFERQWLEFYGQIQATVRATQQQGLADILSEVIQDKESSSESPQLEPERAYDKVSTFLRRQNPKATAGKREAFIKRYRENPVLRKVVAHVDRVEKDIERAVSPRTQLENLISKLFSGNKSLRFGTKVEVKTQDDKNIGLRSLSSGEKQLLRILLGVIDAGSSTIMIDEPELSMHVDWQQEFVTSCRSINSEMQLIAMTHSPELLSNIPDSKIFRI